MCDSSSKIGQKVAQECPLTCGMCRQDDDPVCEDTLTSDASPDPTVNCEEFKRYCTGQGNEAQQVQAQCRLTCGSCSEDAFLTFE